MSGGLVRVSDAERDRVVASLREHLVEGRLSLEEFSQRTSAAYAATTAADLAALEHDLPAPSTAVPARRRSAVRFLVAVFGSTKRTGSLRVREHLLSLSVFGSVTLDLRGALVEGDTISINSVTVFGSLDVIVPEGVEVDLNGLAIFGSKQTQGRPVRLMPGAPLVRVHALVVFGTANVRAKAAKEQ
jgi:Domain of unknown function (DUF1707)/Cell wall-active antibiotics response 4TMS YvqF